MRTLIGVLAAATLIGGCGCAELNYVRTNDEAGAPVEATTTTVAAPADIRIPGGWWFNRDADPALMCNSPVSGGLTIPCRDVMLVCGYTEVSGWTNVIMPTVFSCTDQSPTAIDVCITRPEAEWAWYGYTREECDALRSR